MKAKRKVQRTPAPAQATSTPAKGTSRPPQPSERSKGSEPAPKPKRSPAAAVAVLVTALDDIHAGLGLGKRLELLDSERRTFRPLERIDPPEPLNAKWAAALATLAAAADACDSAWTALCDGALDDRRTPGLAVDLGVTLMRAGLHLQTAAWCVESASRPPVVSDLRDWESLRSKIDDARDRLRVLIALARKDKLPHSAGDKIDRAIGLLLSNPSLSMREIARTVGVAPSTLSRDQRFRRVWDAQKAIDHAEHTERHPLTRGEARARTEHGDDEDEQPSADGHEDDPRNTRRNAQSRSAR